VWRRRRRRKKKGRRIMKSSGGSATSVVGGIVVRQYTFLIYRSFFVLFIVDLPFELFFFFFLFLFVSLGDQIVAMTASWGDRMWEVSSTVQYVLHHVV
jgi:hypothetical protein